MSEVSNIEAEKIAWNMAEVARQKIERDYGPGSNTPKSGHDVRHFDSVITNGLSIVDLAIFRGRIEPIIKPLFIIGISQHDIDQSSGKGQNEVNSGLLTVTGMTETGIFLKNRIAQVHSGIMSTVIRNNGGKVAQSAKGDDILGQYMADADLASLGMPEEQYLAHAELLYEEWAEDGVSRVEALTRSACILDGHKFYTPEARILFPNQAGNLALTMAMLKEIS